MKLKSCIVPLYHKAVSCKTIVDLLLLYDVEAEIQRHERFATKFSGNDHLSSELRREEAAEEAELLKEETQAKMTRRVSRLFSNPFALFIEPQEESRRAVPQ